MLEQDIQSKVINYLKSAGAYIVKTMKASKGGTPDVLCCYQGKFYAMEIKRPGEIPEPLQRYQLEKIQKAGGIAGVVRSVDDAKLMLDKVGAQ